MIWPSYSELTGELSSPQCHDEPGEPTSGFVAPTITPLDLESAYQKGRRDAMREMTSFGQPCAKCRHWRSHDVVSIPQLDASSCDNSLASGKNCG